MPFKDYEEGLAPYALPDGFDLDPTVETSAAPDVPGGFWGAAFRMENPIVSAETGYRFSGEFDPDYRPWNDIQGTHYEAFADRFTDARNASQTELMKAQIDRELDDRKALEAAGGWGFMAETVAGLLTPTSFLPGGAVVRNAKGGVSVLRSALNVGGAAGFAVAMDELILQNTQQTRTPEESYAAIGGSVILGGLIGSVASGAMSRAEFKASSNNAVHMIETMQKVDSHIASVNAAVNTSDFTLRREALFNFFDRIPVLRGVVRSDPILRSQLSDFTAVRAGVADLTESILQYKVNEAGQTVGRFDMPAETAIKVRRNTDLSNTLGMLNRQFADYVNDGEVGLVGRITAPAAARWSNLTQADGKMTRTQFMEEVGYAAMTGDVHPIPQIQKAAQEVRQRIFERVKNEAIDVGLFDADILPKFSASYLMRIYDVEKIAAHMWDGSENDLATALQGNMLEKRMAADVRLQNDRTVEDLERDRFQTNERMRTAQTALNRATKKAQAKRDRAQAAMKREGAVQRATGALRRMFEKRSDALNDTLMQGDELDAFQSALKEARGADNLEPDDIVKAIRGLGGIKDDGSGELKNILDTSYATVARKDGMHPDYMRAALVEMGYLQEGTTVNDLYDAIASNTRGDKVYSMMDSVDLDRYQTAVEFRDALLEAGIDPAWSAEKIIQKMPGMSRNQKTTKAKAGEAKRSAKKAGEKEVTAEDRLDAAYDRLMAARDRLEELEDIVGPKVRAEIKAAKEDLKKIIPALDKAKKARSADEFYAGLDDNGIKEIVQDTLNSITGLKPGEHWIHSAMAKPTRARTLDAPDTLLAPWLVKDIGQVISQYHNAMVPDIELTRRFGDVNLTEVERQINEEMHSKLRALPENAPKKARDKITTEAQERIKDLKGMAERMRGIYGVPANPDQVWVRGGRIARTLSYTGYLGGMMVSAIPDVAGVIGRNGLDAAFGSFEAAVDFKRFTMALRDQAELGAVAEWYLNSRAASIFEVTNAYGRGSKMERGLGVAAHGFGVATGMVPWNVAWKTIGGAFTASKISKAAVRVSKGQGSKKDLLKLAENGIDTVMADRIAKQIDQFADKNGSFWLPQARLWDDPEAFDAFAGAMNREMDLMIITPGQDKPLSFSNEVGKFFGQFKSFPVSAHHRILLSGMQRADGAVLSQAVTALLLGMIVSRIKSNVGGYEQKEGTALWADAIDRSGMMGWLMDVYQPAKSLAAPVIERTTGIDMGEPTSRFQSRSQAMGLLGPSVDMGIGFWEATSAMANGKMTDRDARKLLRPVPGNNLPYFMGLTKQVAEGMADAFSD